MIGNAVNVAWLVRVLHRQRLPVLRTSMWNQGQAQAAHLGQVRDVHSFRVTWITLARSAGVLMEGVRCVTGHATADIVLKHYVQPGREDFRKVLHSAMPALLTQGVKTTAEQFNDTLFAATQETSWRAGLNVRERAKQMAA